MSLLLKRCQDIKKENILDWRHISWLNGAAVFSLSNALLPLYNVYIRQPQTTMKMGHLKEKKNLNLAIYWIGQQTCNFFGQIL